MWSAWTPAQDPPELSSRTQRARTAAPGSGARTRLDTLRAAQTSFACGLHVRRGHSPGTRRADRVQEARRPRRGGGL